MHIQKFRTIRLLIDVFALLKIRPGPVKGVMRVFDIGANVGSFVASSLAAGASDIVAVEPDPDACAQIRTRFAGDARVHVVQAACTDHAGGSISFYRNIQHKTISTVEKRWIETSRFAGQFDWEETPLKVPCVTLDSLIAEYGSPDMIKVDVEGHEKTVFYGLTQKYSIREIQFEWTEEFWEQAHDILRYLGALGFCEIALQEGDGDVVPQYTLDVRGFCDYIHALPIKKERWGMLWVRQPPSP